ncbi:MAG: PAS domain S-box protein [Nitrospinae bacterium]|nr:PAS domain S-box protein [Nitrospinota bacterium]
MDAVKRERRRIFSLALVMAFVSFSILSIAFYFLYEASLKDQQGRLLESVKSHARLIEQIGVMEEAEGLGAETAIDKTLAVLINSHSLYAGFGRTGEFTFGKREGDTIVFLLGHRHYDMQTPKPVPFNSGFAVPMQKALSGYSGPMLARDYRGKMVLAAVEPVMLGGRKFGMVAKIDMEEVREPFIKAVGIAVTSASIIILIGILVFLRVGGLLVTRIQESELGREEAEHVLRQSEERYRLLVENISDIVFLYRLLPEAGIEYISGSAEGVIGYSPEEMYANPDFGLMVVHPDDRQKLEALITGNADWEALLVLRWMHKDGHTVWIEQKSTPIYNEQGELSAIHGIARDVTARVLAEYELKRTVLALRILSECNAALISIAGEKELLEAVCKSLVETGGYLLAWVGLVAEDEVKSVRPAASAGKDEGYLDVINISLADPERSKGPTGVALKTGIASKVDDIATDERFVPWRDEALKRGYRSSVALPMEYGGKVMGALNIYAARPYAFSVGEIAPFQELANDLAFGLNRLKERKEKELADKALVERLRMEQMVVELSRLFASSSEVDLNRMLEVIGKGVNANRAYIFRLRESGTVMDNTHEWCKPGTEPQIENLQGLEASVIPWWMAKLNWNEDIVISDVDTLSDEASAEKAILQPQHIKSLIVVPVNNRENRLTGFMGFDDTENRREWRPEDSRLLRIAAEMLSVHFARTESEKLLRESELRFRSVTETATDAIISADHEQRIITWNPGATRIFGYTEEEMLGTPLPNLIPDLFSPKHVAGVVEREKNGSFNKRHLIAQIVELNGKNKAGDLFRAEVSISSWEVGSKKYYSLIIRDVTRRKKQEEELKRSNEELKRAVATIEQSQMLLLRSEKLASVGTLSAGVAHEILNPLNIIGTITQLMLMEEKRKAEKENLEEIMVQIQRAAKITNNLKLFARQRKMEIKPVDINAMFDHTIALLEHDLNLDNITVERDFTPGLPMVSADEDQLTQVALNLLTNSRDAMKLRRKGTITITTSPAADGGVDIRFCDTGPGIPKEIIGKIFDPFFTTKEPGKGTGLGLSVTYRIIEEHNGSIRVESLEGVGTCFIIHLPKGGEKLPDARNT